MLLRHSRNSARVRAHGETVAFLARRRVEAATRRERDARNQSFWNGVNGVPRITLIVKVASTTRAPSRLGMHLNPSDSPRPVTLVPREQVQQGTCRADWRCTSISGAAPGIAEQRRKLLKLSIQPQVQSLWVLLATL